MNVSHEALTGIKRFEGLRLQAYQCAGGVWTIGYGHTAGVRPGQRITQEEAEALLRETLRGFERFVEKLGVARRQGQFDALVSFAYNVGMEALGRSSLLRKIRRGASEREIRAEFLRWNKAGGRVLTGLMRRRSWEADVYFS